MFRSVRDLWRWLLAVAVVAVAVQIPSLSQPAAAATCTNSASNPLACVSIGMTDSTGQTFARLTTNDSSDAVGDQVAINRTFNRDGLSSWRLTANADGTFAILNLGNGLCMQNGYWITMESCTSGNNQRWYLTPSTPGSPNRYYVRAVDNNRCLDLSHGDTDDDSWITGYDCGWSWNQRFTILPNGSGSSEYSNDQAGAVDNAVHAHLEDYWAGRCSADSSTCSWREDSEDPAGVETSKCIASPVYNGTQDNLTRTLTTTTTTGWSVTAGYSLTTKLATGDLPGLIAKIELSSTWSFSATRNVSDAAADGYTMTIRPGQFGWVAVSYEARNVHGIFTFDAGGHPFEATSDVQVPVAGTATYSPTTGSARPVAC